MERVQENKMGTMPIGKLLMGVSVPIVISMIVQALYNVVDSIFVAKLSENALTAVSLAFPVQNLMIAVGVGTAVGVNSLLSRRLGEKNFEAANRAASNGIFLAIISWLAFVLVGLLLSTTFFNAVAPIPVGATAAEAASILEIRAMGVSYMMVVTIGSPGLFISIINERLLQATGRSVYSMVSQLVGAITNIVLDPIMIFGLLGFPKMGVTGAALATIIGQILGMLVGLYFNIAKNHDIKIQIKGFRPGLKTIKHIYQVGLPSIVMQAIGSAMVFGLNLILAAFSTTAVAVMGVYYKLQSFVFMPVFGFNNGMISIIGYNYGARNKERIRQTLRIGLLVCAGIMLAGTVAFWLIPEVLLGFFDASPHMLEIGVPALRSISLCFPLAAISIVFSGVFQALGQGVYSLIMSLVRQLVLILPLAWLLSRLWGLHAVWYAFILAEGAGIVLATLFFAHVWKSRIKPLQLPNPTKEAADALAEISD
ncbi:MATE family efflux transporter [Ruminococcaceae bacterium OttesenSCG-928-A16]|nr:MATE family efflux transporter [Ruminococcaceae bacterium OttesenSCG-928-A16]